MLGDAAAEIIDEVAELGAEAVTIGFPRLRVSWKRQVPGEIPLPAFPKVAIKHAMTILKEEILVDGEELTG